MKSQYLRIDLNDHAVIEDIRTALKKYDFLIENQTQPAELRWTAEDLWTITLGRLTHSNFNKNQQKEADKIIQSVLDKHEPLFIEFSGQIHIEYRTAAFDVLSKSISALQTALQTALEKAQFKFTFQTPRITFAIKTSDFKEEERKSLEELGQLLKNKKYKESLYTIKRISGSQLSAQYELGEKSKKLAY